jgi:hypothetical protein
LRLSALALAVASFLLIACSNDSEQPEAVTETPAATVALGAPTAEPTLQPEATTPVPTRTQLEAPEVPRGVVVLGEGMVALAIAPGDRQFIEPLTLAQEFGPPPACAGFAFVFGWRIDDDAFVRIEGQLRGATVQVAKGSAGATTSGRMVLEFVNEGDTHVTGEVRYLIGEFR